MMNIVTKVDKSKVKASLYPSPMRQRAGSFRPRFYTNATDTFRAVNQGDRSELLKYSRELFCSLPNLGGAILAKNSWAFAEGWVPVFKGADKEWGAKAEEWLINSWYNLCNVAGQNFDFRTSLFLSGVSLDVDGDSLMVMVEGRDGWPFISFISSHAIGCRSYGEEEVKTGRFRGSRIRDGVIVNSQGRPIGYRVLGDKPEDDYDVPAASGNLIYEPEFADQLRGIPKISRAILDFMDVQDINAFVKRALKNESRLGIMHYTLDGEPDAGANIMVEDEANLSPSPANADEKKGLYVEPISGDEILYMTANSGEKIEAIRGSDRPTQNGENFVNRIERGALYAIGWPYDLIDGSKIGGASVRLIQDQARKSIKQRQATIERRAKTAIAFALSRAMKLGLLPENYNDQWWNFEFLKPAQITVDSGYEEQADRENLLAGTTTQTEILAKKGKRLDDWIETRKGEVSKVIAAAKEVAEEQGVDFNIALSALNKSILNGLPLSPNNLVDGNPTTLNN